MAEAETIHAGCVVLGEAGILIRGPAGSGKSTLARALVTATRAQGRFARIVSDDRTRIAAAHGRLIARPVAAIAGRVEVRGIGILPVAHEPGAVLRLVVDCTAEEPARLPEPEDNTVSLCGIVVSRIRHGRGAILDDLVLSRWSGFRDTLMTDS
jgi:serine kinase of HPr protein (carbohydrate metabolism regulator)